MRYDRLLAAAQAVEESPLPEHFTMKDFFHRCGTPACVLGHYAAREDLQSEYKLRQTSIGWWANGLGTSEEHFEISLDQWDELFAIDGCDGATTPAAAGRYIRDFVARHGGPVT